jgi:hypothetical protein
MNQMSLYHRPSICTSNTNPTAPSPSTPVDFRKGLQTLHEKTTCHTYQARHAIDPAWRTKGSAWPCKCSQDLKARQLPCSVTVCHLHPDVTQSTCATWQKRFCLTADLSCQSAIYTAQA